MLFLAGLSESLPTPSCGISILKNLRLLPVLKSIFSTTTVSTDSQGPPKPPPPNDEESASLFSPSPEDIDILFPIISMSENR